MGDLPSPSEVRARAAACGIDLSPATEEILLAHARAVCRANPLLHLTTVPPEEFLERHLGEAFEGAALLSPDTAGRCFDLGSGNGYPGIPLALSRPGLDLLLVESKARKAAFLRSLGIGGVLESAVRRVDDLETEGPAAVLACRAMEGWERILPRLAGALGPGGCLLLWAGEEVPRVLRRTAWSTWRLLDDRSLPGRVRTRVWRLGPSHDS